MGAKSRPGSLNKHLLEMVMLGQGEELKLICMPVFYRIPSACVSLAGHCLYGILACYLFFPHPRVAAAKTIPGQLTYIPISGTERATVIATQTKKAGSRIWEKRALVLRLAQWKRLTISPWNWRNLSQEPSSLKLPCPESTCSSESASWSAAGKNKKEAQKRLRLSLSLSLKQV